MELKSTVIDLVTQPRRCERLRAPARFEWIRCLGHGGMSVVHLARDTNSGRCVALKQLNTEQEHVPARFHREAEILMRLDHPSIVRVHEIFEYDGCPTLIMDHLSGGNLAQAKLSHHELLSAFRQVAYALQHAHAQGIIHRDIKPENILLDRTGRAYISDFGLARDLCGGSGRSVSLDGQVFGTPAYMAPEQARGDRGKVDLRSDVYGLGATLYRMLAGTPPFTGDHVIDVLHAVIHERPTPLCELRPDLPAALCDAVDRSLEKKRRRRFQTMRELARALRR